MYLTKKPGEPDKVSRDMLACYQKLSEAIPHRKPTVLHRPVESTPPVLLLSSACLWYVAQ